MWHFFAARLAGSHSGGRRFESGWFYWRKPFAEWDLDSLLMAISCPQCGGTDLRQITPGFFECVSQVQVGAIPPGVHGNREYMPVPGPCGHRFQVSSPGQTELCSCGRDLIGACKDCGRRLCGLHGTREGEFLCRDCIGRRKERAETKWREQYEAAISVVHICEPITASQPADTSGPRPDPPPGQPLASTDRGLGEHSLWQTLWADGEARGFPNLVGLTWNARYGGDGEGECWQIVHHHVHVREGTRLERRFLLPDQWVHGLHAVCDAWTAYAFSPGTGRLCDIKLFSGSELSDNWTRLCSRAGGSALHDLRWADPMELPKLSDLTTLRPVPLEDEKPLFAQLEENAESHGLERWIGLTWIDYQGRRCRIVDDAMVQANRSGLPPAYRAIVIDKSKDGTTIDREIIRAEAVDKRFDEIGRELGGSLQKGEFSWTATD